MTLKKFCTLFAATALCACQSDYDRTVSKIQNDQYEDELKKLDSKSTADTEESEARGTKTCHIRQTESAFQARKRVDTANRKVRYFGSDITKLGVRVYPNGSAGIAVTEDTFPGTNAYFLIGGKRYVADGDEYASLDQAAIAVLKGDAVIKFSWTGWPYRDEINQEDVIGGFARSYQECLEFLRKR